MTNGGCGRGPAGPWYREPREPYRRAVMVNAQNKVHNAKRRASYHHAGVHEDRGLPVSNEFDIPRACESLESIFMFRRGRTGTAQKVQFWNP